jgi:polyhydroxyalkanoate synthesis regulator phasin
VKQLRKPAIAGLAAVLILGAQTLCGLAFIWKESNKRYAETEIRFDAIESAAAARYSEAETVLAETVLKNREALAETEERLKGVMKEIVTEGTARTARAIAAVQKQSARTEETYRELLAEQRKKTLENLYNEETLLAQKKRAEELYCAGQFRQAHDEYEKLWKEEPWNEELQFYRYYTLFLMNKGDRGQYRAIREGFNNLEKLGYTRAEMAETLDYMAGEEQGAAS